VFIRVYVCTSVPQSIKTPASSAGGWPDSAALLQNRYGNDVAVAVAKYRRAGEDICCSS
jgi:hypothetical protein